MGIKVRNNIKKTGKDGDFYYHVSESLSNFMDRDDNNRCYHISECFGGFDERIEYAKKNPMTPKEFKEWSTK